MSHIHKSTESEKKVKSENPEKMATIKHLAPTSAHKKRKVRAYSHTGIRIPKVPEQGLLIIRYGYPIKISFD